MRGKRGCSGARATRSPPLGPSRRSSTSRGRRWAACGSDCGRSIARAIFQAFFRRVALPQAIGNRRHRGPPLGRRGDARPGQVPRPARAANQRVAGPHLARRWDARRPPAARVDRRAPAPGRRAHPPLRGLSPAAVESLGARVHRNTEGLQRRHSGNPFFVTEVLASDAPGRSTHRARTRSSLGRPGCPPPARELCELASVVPSRVELSLLETAAGGTFAALDEFARLRDSLPGPGCRSVPARAGPARHRGYAAAAARPRAARPHPRRTATSAARTPRSLARLVHHAAGAGDRLSPCSASRRPQASTPPALGAHRRGGKRISPWRCAMPPISPRSAGAQLLEARAYECYLTDRMQDGIDSCSAARALWARIGDRAPRGQLPLLALADGVGTPRARRRRTGTAISPSRRSRRCLPAPSWRWRGSRARDCTPPPTTARRRSPLPRRRCGSLARWETARSRRTRSTCWGRRTSSSATRRAGR